MRLQVLFPFAQYSHFGNLLRWADLIQAVAGPDVVASTLAGGAFTLPKPLFVPPPPPAPPAPAAASAGPTGKVRAGGAVERRSVSQRQGAFPPAAVWGLPRNAQGADAPQPAKGAAAAAAAPAAAAAAAPAAPAAAGADKAAGKGGKDKAAAKDKGAAPAAAAAAAGASTSAPASAAAAAGAAASSSAAGEGKPAKKEKEAKGAGGAAPADAEPRIDMLDIRVGRIVKVREMMMRGTSEALSSLTIDGLCPGGKVFGLSSLWLT